MEQHVASGSDDDNDHEMTPSLEEGQSEARNPTAGYVDPDSQQMGTTSNPDLEQSQDANPSNSQNAESTHTLQSLTVASGPSSRQTEVILPRPALEYVQTSITEEEGFESGIPESNTSAEQNVASVVDKDNDREAVSYSDEGVAMTTSTATDHADPDSRTMANIGITEWEQSTESDRGNAQHIPPIEELQSLTPSYESYSVGGAMALLPEEDNREVPSSQLFEAVNGSSFASLDDNYTFGAHEVDILAHGRYCQD